MYSSRTKFDLMIEIWECLDCESVGAKEIIAIEKALAEKFGEAAATSPMVIARLLADEGAELRHSELMELYVLRVSERPYEAALRNLLKLGDLAAAESSIRRVEALRNKLAADGDREGLRLLRHDVIEGKEAALAAAAREPGETHRKALQLEIAEWLTLWLHSPEMFEQWLKLRKRSPSFRAMFENERS